MTDINTPTIGDLVRNPHVNQEMANTYGNSKSEIRKLMDSVNIETTIFKFKTDPNYREGHENSALGKVLKHLEYDLSSGSSPDLTEEAMNLLLGPRRPDSIGEMLHNTFPMEKETQRFPYFNKTGKSQRTSRAIADVNTRGDRHKWLDFKADEELMTGDGVDLKFREDNNPMTISYWMGSIGTQHFEDLSQICINQITQKDGQFGSSGTYNDMSGNTTDKGIVHDVTTVASFDGIMSMIVAARNANWAPDCALMTHNMMHNLLKADDFKDADKFQAFADYNGLTIPMLFNVKLFTSSQVDSTEGADHIWMWEKNRYSFFLVRRYGLVTSWENKQQNREGLNYTTRYGFAVGDGKAIIRSE